MEKRLTFAYGRTLAFSRVSLFAIAFGFLGVFLVLAQSVPLAPLALFAGILVLGTVLFGLSPLFTQHWLTRSRLILRQGWYFQVVLPLSEIRSLGAADETTPQRVPLGIHRPLGRATLYVTGGQSGLVVARLSRPRRFWSSFGLSATELVFDVLDREAFLRAVEERRGLLAPVQADRPDAHLRD